MNEPLAALVAFANWTAQLDDPSNPEHATVTLVQIAERAQEATAAAIPPGAVLVTEEALAVALRTTYGSVVTYSVSEADWRSAARFILATLREPE